VVADYGNHRVQVFTKEGEFVRKFGGKGTESGQFNGPSAIAIGQDGTVIVAEDGNHRIQVFGVRFTS
jgi:tripartite motif-containing protein 2/3